MLVVALRVHEGVGATAREEVLHRTAIELDPLDLLAGAEPLLDDRAVLEVLDLDLHEGPQVARRHVGVLRDHVHVAVEQDGHAGAEIGGLHGRVSSGRAGRPVVADSGANGGC